MAGLPPRKVTVTTDDSGNYEVEFHDDAPLGLSEYSDLLTALSMQWEKHTGSLPTLSDIDMIHALGTRMFAEGYTKGATVAETKELVETVARLEDDRKEIVEQFVGAPDKMAVKALTDLRQRVMTARGVSPMQDRRELFRALTNVMVMIDSQVNMVISTAAAAEESKL